METFKSSNLAPNSRFSPVHKCQPGPMLIFIKLLQPTGQTWGSWLRKRLVRKSSLPPLSWMQCMTALSLCIYVWRPLSPWLGTDNLSGSQIWVSTCSTYLCTTYMGSIYTSNNMGKAYCSPLQVQWKSVKASVSSVQILNLAHRDLVSNPRSAVVDWEAFDHSPFLSYITERCFFFPPQQSLDSIRN